jgi:hypothetical protein
MILLTHIARSVLEHPLPLSHLSAQGQPIPAPLSLLARGHRQGRAPGIACRQPACLPGHYEHGFDEQTCAPYSTHSLFLKGGNDSNFGMTLKLPTPTDDTGTPVALPDDAESDDPGAFDGAFRPDSVSFYVRTDNPNADAGHFILGESNEVNKRVAQFQFTKDGRMGLLGTGGTTHGATPYLPNRWYLVELRFDWDKKEVRSPPEGCSPPHVP